ncbi:MAG: dockerin type I repeat-containing protein [Ruminococcus sp.]|nr:dockerin type I repeat-containing protein [Ruminococcus sp.]
MKRVLKKITASLMSGLMLFSSTYAVLGSTSAANNEVQPRGTYHVYGDVNNDGRVNSTDAVIISHCLVEFKNVTGGATRMPLEYAEAQMGKYPLPVPQAADVDGDNYITDEDIQCIKNYVLQIYDEAGRCGQLFFIN